MIPPFIDRQPELKFLDSLLHREYPGPGQLVLLHGRRRVGKTRLLKHWISSTGLPATYWVAEKEIAALQRSRLFAHALGNLQARTHFDSWVDCWAAVAERLGREPHILVLDEFSYAVEADPVVLSALQNLWDAQWQDSSLIVVLCGSHIHAMESLLSHSSPLFGRYTGQWHLQPLPYAALQDFFPDWPVEDRVTAYAIFGGVPAYWVWLNPRQSLWANMRNRILAPGSPFLGEPESILHDEVREVKSYLSIIRSLGTGHHSLADLAMDAMISDSHLTGYLRRLQDLHLVERRLPLTTPRNRRDHARNCRWHLSDPFFRWFYRFAAGTQAENSEYDTERHVTRIKGEIRAFVGATTFEELCRQWVIGQSRAGTLPPLDEVGSHWSSTGQVDVVGISWANRTVIIGECKWVEDDVKREVVRGVVEKKGREVLKHLPDMGTGWTPRYLLFGRAGFTDAAQAEARAQRIQLVAAQQLDADLRQAFLR